MLQIPYKPTEEKTVSMAYDAVVGEHDYFLPAPAPERHLVIALPRSAATFYYTNMAEKIGQKSIPGEYLNFYCMERVLEGGIDALLDYLDRMTRIGDNMITKISPYEVMRLWNEYGVDILEYFTHFHCLIRKDRDRQVRSWAKTRLTGIHNAPINGVWKYDRVLEMRNIKPPSDAEIEELISSTGARKWFDDGYRMMEEYILPRLPSCLILEFEDVIRRFGS